MAKGDWLGSRREKLHGGLAGTFHSRPSKFVAKKDGLGGGIRVLELGEAYYKEPFQKCHKGAVWVELTIS